MTSSDERIAVAQNLRNNATKRGVSLDYLGSEQVNSWWLLLHSIGCDSNGQEAAFNLLADLIDPTCEVESVDSTGGLLAYRLSCGHTAYRPAYVQGPPPVCPGCGARVVSGDGDVYLAHASPDSLDLERIADELDRIHALCALLLKTKGASGDE